jgi:hypothetical protein
VTGSELVPDGFDVPRELVAEQFRLEPLGPQHNERDHAAWTSSIGHIRSTPGFETWDWPPAAGMPLDRNLADLRRHRADRAHLDKPLYDAVSQWLSADWPFPRIRYALRPPIGGARTIDPGAVEV